MAEQPQANAATAAQIRTKLHEVAQLIRETRHLEPQGQRALADLVEELSKALELATIPSAETAHLADSVGHLAQALQVRHETGLLAAARERLEQAAVRAEAQAPLATGLARRLLEALANLGI